MKLLTMIVVCLSGLAALCQAATHSAWSSPILWDGATGIQSQSLSTPTAAGFSILPNPASGSNPVSFQIKGKLESKAELKVIDVSGKLIQSFSLAGLRAGSSVTWNPAAKNGKTLASGLYVARLKSGSTVIEQKFMLLK